MVKFLLCFFLLFLINSCGGTSTDAGETEILYIDRLDDASIFEEGESGRPDSNRKKTGFYRHNNHQWGFEYGTDSDKRSPAHISLPLDGEGYTEWYIQWSKTENISEEVYYICNANNEDISNFNKNLIPIGIDECTINSDEIDKLHKSCGTINIRDYKDYEQIGICKKFQDNPASLEAILFIHPYNKVNFELYSIHYGGTKSSSFSNSLNRVFNQGVASITLNDKEFNREDYNTNYSHSDISFRENVFFIGAGTEKSSCYKNIPDDIDILKDYINTSFFETNSLAKPGRALVWIGKYGIRYWTFNEDKDICYDELISYPDREKGTEYLIGTINSKNGVQCTSFTPQRKIRYNKGAGAWEISSPQNMGEWSSDFSVIDPFCHIIYNPSDKDEQQIWARHISISSRAVTKIVGSGQIAFALQNDTYAMLHEVGHLLNLSDIELEGNLMNYSFSSNIGQNLRYSEVMARENDLSPFDKPEHQWDCLHDVSRCAYPF